MKASRTSPLWAALAVAAVAAVGLTLGVSVSLAAPIEQTRFDEPCNEIVEGYCGDLVSSGCTSAGSAWLQATATPSARRSTRPTPPTELTVA